ncbi:hypothetical protein EDD18DRAFT_570207 [Armillaria luteobubalina]|uniref:Uncharacterized protein n=1 Tax=Armillaria luteobubalina TaxID=153913 RepID=A0AA39PSN6_9AGAR|nr:hypothetical protein EDD18DRAFT_570207 [Armillaria luteobubalina]
MRRRLSFRGQTRLLKYHDTRTRPLCSVPTQEKCTVDTPQRGVYTIVNVARTWTYETACTLGIEDIINPNLLWNEYFEWFGPRYRLEVVASNMEDMNVKTGLWSKSG